MMRNFKMFIFFLLLSNSMSTFASVNTCAVDHLGERANGLVYIAVDKMPLSWSLNRREVRFDKKNTYCNSVDTKTKPKSAANNKYFYLKPIDYSHIDTSPEKERRVISNNSPIAGQIKAGSDGVTK